MDFNGQKCPACGRSFDQDDDIVVCPVCGTPQHRSCWDERGECVNAARHAEGYVWQPETPEYSAEPHTEEQTQDRQNTQICPVCGSENEPNSLSCTNCGAPLTAGGAQPFNPFFKAGEAGNPFLYGVTLDPESEIDGAKVKDIACTVQSASARYIPKFKAMAEKKKKISFNWAAFFFSPYWLFYRKLWQAGLIFMGLMLAVALPFTSKVEAFTTAYQAYSEAIYTSSQADVAAALEKVMSAMIPTLPMLGIQIVLHIVAGFIANPLYKRSVTAKVQKLRAAFPDDRAFEAATMRKGGTSILLAFASYIGYYIIYNLLLYAAELLIK